MIVLDVPRPEPIIHAFALDRTWPIFAFCLGAMVAAFLTGLTIGRWHCDCHENRRQKRKRDKRIAWALRGQDRPVTPPPVYKHRQRDLEERTHYNIQRHRQ